MNTPAISAYSRRAKQNCLPRLSSRLIVLLIFQCYHIDKNVVCFRCFRELLLRECSAYDLSVEYAGLCALGNVWRKL